MNNAALHKLSYGLYVVSSLSEGRFNAQIANVVFQVTATPPAIAVCLHKDNLTHEFIQTSKVYIASILSRDTPLSFIGALGFRSGRDVDKFAGINYKIGVTRAPVVLDNALAYLEVRVDREVDVGTHTVFIGEMVGADIIKDGEPMTYAYYHEVKRGSTPRSAPVYHEEEKMAAVGAEKYQCSVCGYIYDPEKGDPDGGIKPGTPFEEIPEHWVCPVCGAAKDKFKKMS